MSISKANQSTIASVLKSPSVMIPVSIACQWLLSLPGPESSSSSSTNSFRQPGKRFGSSWTCLARFSSSLCLFQRLMASCPHRYWCSVVILSNHYCWKSLGMILWWVVWPVSNSPCCSIYWFCLWIETALSSHQGLIGGYSVFRQRSVLLESDQLGEIGQDLASWSYPPVNLSCQSRLSQSHKTIQ